MPGFRQRRSERAGIRTLDGRERDDLKKSTDLVKQLRQSGRYAASIRTPISPTSLRTILIPNRSRSADTLAIINGHNTSTHPLIETVRDL